MNSNKKSVPNVKKPVENAADISTLVFPSSLQHRMPGRENTFKHARALQTHLQQPVHTHESRNFGKSWEHGRGEHKQVLVAQAAAAEI